MLPAKRFTDFIDQNNLFGRDSKILAAVSGGMDSVVMAHLLKSAGFSFGIAHCNFQLRGDESLADQEFCNRLAGQLRVPFHTTNFDTLKFVADNKISTQMAARQLRYQWFEQVRQQAGYDYIALAHHQNDAIETILLNLTRGTGIAGMHGILPKNGNLVRPMLFLKREEIEDIIHDNKLVYVEDSSNSSVKYARNKIRLEVIPKLKELNPALEQTFENNLAHFRDLDLFLEQQIAKLKTDLFVYHDDEIHLPLAEVNKLEPKPLLLFKLLQEYGFNETTIDDLILALDKQPGKIFETPGFVLLLDRGKLILTKKNSDSQPPVQINKYDHEAKYGAYKLTLLHDDSPLIVKDNAMAASIDAGLLQYPLTLRAWQQGDHFHPLGMKTRKKLSDFFIDQKVPLHQKNEIPVLVNGNGDIIWIGGYRPDDRYKVTGNTKKVTIFELVI
ncbi:MAG TPA: tRNA lysidine(34) synthetase TilS [Mucilaginibacter sp.]|jgi:tRNA(Ile)-lysidine synthase|nr:tRNA lysidine(34) synthetase TilS [Mucilaginibacter sp.]